MNQRDRTYRALQLAGRHGVCQIDFLLPNVCDGGKPVTRLGARIHELREAGHDIREIGRRHGCSVYSLVEARVSTPLTAVSTETLFVPREKPMLAIDDDWDRQAA